MRQIDITLRHHERQDYIIYKEIYCLVNQLKVLKLIGSCFELFFIQLRQVSDLIKSHR